MATSLRCVNTHGYSLPPLPFAAVCVKTTKLDRSMNIINILGGADFVVCLLEEDGWGAVWSEETTSLCHHETNLGEVSRWTNI